MDLWKKIEIYMDRSVDFNSEVILRADTNYQSYIDVWNIIDKSQPTLEQLNNLDLTDYQLDQAKQEKISKNLTNFNAARNGILKINNVPINIDPTSSINISGKILEITVNKINQQPPLTIIWFDDVNQSHSYTEDEFIALGAAVSAYTQQLQIKYSNNVLAINAATTKNQLAQIDINYSIS